MILGASGLLGSQVLKSGLSTWRGNLFASYYRRPILPIGTHDKYRVDLTDQKALGLLLKQFKPRTVINCAGVVKSICHDSHEVLLLNSVLPHYVAKVIAQWGGRLIHVSTDCVFSGDRGAYSEEDKPDAEHLYGRSKLLGEVIDPPHLTIRTSFIGFEQDTQRGLLEWFLRQKGEVPGYKNVIWSGLTAPCLAQILLTLAKATQVSGLLHVHGEPVSKYELLSRIAQLFKKTDITIKPVDKPVSDMSLKSNRLNSLGINVPSMDEMLSGLANGR
jgi:dTDP-4-dehydrorhamnose reductase